MTNEQIIWNYLKNQGLTDIAVSGIMGNLQAESNMQSNNVQNTYEKQVGSDEEYTYKVDNNIYTNFINDRIGYGIAQWTEPNRKQNLYNICKKNNISISNLNSQLELLNKELKNSNLIEKLNLVNTIQEASDIILTEFEKPKDQSDKVKQERAKYSENIYLQFKQNISIFNNIIERSAQNMKYNTSNKPLVCMMTNSTCYKQTNKMSIKGILWHSTGANNPFLKRYVQPTETDVNYHELISALGTNTAHNDWNHISIQAGLNAWIGKLANGTVTTVQTMPWDYRPWGCGSGSKGSCNNGWIQFEIAEDSLTDASYFQKVYQEACELTAYLCKLYNINPLGNVSVSGTEIPTILCHQDSYNLGFGSNHADVYHWFNKYGKTMNNVRQDVSQLLGNNIINNNNNNNINSTLSKQIPLLTRTLTKGDTGNDVKQLQETLIKLGYSVGSWGADGDFGEETEKAVKKFQKDNNLKQDGIVGPITWQTLFNNTEQTTPIQDEIYRVRKAWDQPSTQIGAYKDLSMAKQAVDRLGAKIYRVYNSKGQEIYPVAANSSSNNASSNEPYTHIIKPAKIYDDVMLGSSSKDERGQYRGGQAGDQTNKEVWILNWYDQNWNVVLRPKTAKLAEKIAKACEDGCANNNIGYNQYARNTVYLEAIKVGLDLSKITTPCDSDCASFVGTCCVCAGLPANVFYVGDNMPVTSNMRERCLSTKQFTTLNGSMYLRQKNYLRRGDILLNESQHVVIVLQSGKNAEPFNETEIETSNNNYKVRITANRLNVRKGPGVNEEVVAQVSKGYVFTITEEREGYGKLKSGIGWIDLSYTERL